MDQQKRVKVLPNGHLNGGTRIVIQEEEDLGAFIARASRKLWKGQKIGTRLFFDDGGEVLDDLTDVISEDTLYISEGEDWIGSLESVELIYLIRPQ